MNTTDITTCYICSGSRLKKRDGVVRDNPDLEILECCDCGLVFLSSFSHIYEGFYRDSKMHQTCIDIGAWLKEASGDDERRYNTFKRSIKDKSVLDFGCGAGGFLSRAKKTASHVLGVEPEERLYSYFKEIKIPVVPNLRDVTQKFDYITLFHVLEHIADPVLLLSQLREKLKPGGRIIVEVPNANDALLTLYKCRAFSRFTYWSCHLYLYTMSTLLKVSQKADLKKNYIKQIQRYPLSNHLYWLSEGKPAGHKIWSFLDNKMINEHYEKKLANIESCDTILASFSRSK